MREDRRRPTEMFREGRIGQKEYQQLRWKTNRRRQEFQSDMEKAVERFFLERGLLLSLDLSGRLVFLLTGVSAVGTIPPNT